MVIEMTYTDRYEAFRLRDNPFVLLRADDELTVDELQDLVDDHVDAVAEERLDAARRILTNPRNRVGAEVSGLPGVSASNVREMLEFAETQPHLLPVVKLEPLAAGNILAYALVRAMEAARPIPVLVSIIETIIREGVWFDVEEMTTGFEVKREVAGIRAIDASTVSARIRARINSISSLICDSLMMLTPSVRSELLDRLVIESDNDNDLLDQVIDGIAERTVAESEKTILSIVDLTSKSVTTVEGANQTCRNLALLIHTYSMTNAPIIRSREQRGLSNTDVSNLFWRVRSYGIDAVNTVGPFPSATQLFRELRVLVASIDELEVRAAGDCEALTALDRQAYERQERVSPSPNHAPVVRQQTALPSGSYQPTSATTRSTSSSFPIPWGWVGSAVIFGLFALFRWVTADADATTTSYTSQSMPTATSYARVVQPADTSCDGIMAWWDATQTRWDSANAIIDNLNSNSSYYQFETASNQIEALARDQMLSSPPSAAATYNSSLVQLLFMQAEYLTSSESLASFNRRWDSAFIAMQANERSAASQCGITLR